MRRERIRLSRGQKILLNLALCVFLLTCLWGIAGYPVVTAGMEVRRLERTRLLPPSEIVFTAGGEGDIILNDGARLCYPVRALDGTELYLQGRWFAGTGEDWAVLGLVQGVSYDCFLRWFPLEEEGPSLLTFYSGYGYWKEEGLQEMLPGETHNFFPILLVNVPEETVRAEITVRQGERSVTGPGWNMGNGVWLMTPDNQVLPYQGEEERSYTLRLYRPDGSLLLERNGEYWEG